MAKKKRMGRDLNALLGGVSRARTPKNDEIDPEDDETLVDDTSVVDTETPAVESNTASTASAASSKPPIKTQPAHDEQNSSVSDIPMPSTVNLSADSGHQGERVRMLGVDQIRRGMYQPRRQFNEQKLEELAESIRQQGVIQPILVRPYGGSYELIAGERRWRAAQLAGISDIPVIVRQMDDQSVAAVALIENIQRADLNPLEEAAALHRLCDEFSMTHQAVAESVGRSRAAVSNLLRLLDLHEEVKPFVDSGELEMGHARALLGAPKDDQPALARKIVKENLTVRAVEAMIRALREGKTPKKSAAVTDPNIEALGKKLGEVLGAPVSIHHQKSGSGKLEIRYTSVSELEGILGHIK